MVNSVAGSPKDEAKEIFLQVQEGEIFLFEYFFEVCRPPDHISEEDYMKELKVEYFKLKRDYARRLLRIDK